MFKYILNDDIPYLLLSEQSQYHRQLDYPIAIRLIRAKNQITKEGLGHLLSAKLRKTHSIKVKTIKLWERGISTPRTEVREVIDDLMSQCIFTVNWHSVNRATVRAEVERIGRKYLDDKLCPILMDKLNTENEDVVKEKFKLNIMDTSKLPPLYRSWLIAQVVGAAPSGKFVLHMYGLDVIYMLEKWSVIFFRRKLDSILDMSPQLLRKWKCRFVLPGKSKIMKMTEMITELFSSLAQNDAIVQVRWNLYPSDLGSWCTKTNFRSPFYALE